MADELIADGRVSVSVLLNTVRIELICGDGYAAQVLYDEIVERLQRGNGLTLGVKQPLNAATGEDTDNE